MQLILLDLIIIAVGALMVAAGIDATKPRNGGSSDSPSSDDDFGDSSTTFPQHDSSGDTKTTFPRRDPSACMDCKDWSGAFNPQSAHDTGGQEVVDTGPAAYNARQHDVGDCGETIAEDELKKEGYDEVISIKNNSGHGVDKIGRNSKTGEVKVVEVKTTEGNRPPRMTKDQKEGGKEFTRDRLEKAKDAKGHWQAKNAPGMEEAAEKVEEWLDEAPDIQYEVMEIKIENIDHGCKKKSVNTKPWEDRSNK